MSREFTKGPWRYDKREMCIAVPTKCVIANVSGDIPDGEIDANGKLISAAPDLYEALLHISALAKSPAHRGSVETLACVLEVARAALAKADGTEGRTEVQDA